MAYTGVTLPLTGSGDATAAPAVDVVDSLAYQAMKLVDGLEGSTEPVRALSSAPGSSDRALITRPIGSTVHTQAVVMSSQQTVTVGNPTTAVNVANPTTAVTVSNPTTAVSLSSQHTVTVGNPTTAVTVSNPTTAVTVSNPTTAVDLTSAGSTREIGTVNQGSPAGSSTAAWWVRTVTTGTAAGGSTTVDLGSGGSTKEVGFVSQGPASSANFWFTQSIPFSSGNIARTTVATSVDASVIAANANRKALLITNGSTAQMVGLGFSTAAVTTARANVNIYLQANSQLRFGLMGDLPLYRGPIRGINLTSTSVTGGVIVTEFT